MQTDPIGYEDQMNAYAYVGNDPMNYTDPTGQRTVGEYIKDFFGWGKEKAKAEVKGKIKEEIKEEAEERGLTPLEICHAEHCLGQGAGKNPCLLRYCSEEIMGGTPRNSSSDNGDGNDGGEPSSGSTAEYFRDLHRRMDERRGQDEQEEERRDPPTPSPEPEQKMLMRQFY